MAIKLAVAAKTDVGKVRTNNEDAYVVADLNRGDRVTAEKPIDFDVQSRGVLLAVSDGMGGEQAGEVASALVVETLRKVLVDIAPEEEEGKTAITRIIEDAVTKANEEVFAAAKDPGKRGMGATLTAVFVNGPSAYIAEIGDSRAYLLRGRRMRQMTKDQSFVQLLLDSGAITEEEAANYPHKNIILQAIGQQKNLNIAVGKLGLRRGDRLLLCSDGLSNKVTPDEMRDMVCDAKSIDEACAKLIETANERGGDDNATVVLAEATGDDLIVYRDEETVTQTFEVVKAGPNTDIKSDRPPPPEEEKSETPPEAEPAPLEDQSDLKSRPLQMAVAVVMMAVMVCVVYLIFR
ncbi:MAG TPA: Stp1/IreP family PP2C-type Ser/Thr phosphatase [Polyangiaceae bacterium]|jgi:serine/threonine protein phosphatase PrpC